MRSCRCGLESVISMHKTDDISLGIFKGNRPAVQWSREWLGHPPRRRRRRCQRRRPRRFRRRRR